MKPIARVGLLLWTARSERGWSSVDGARVGKLPERELLAIERGDVIPEEGLVRRLAMAFGLDPDKLLVLRANDVAERAHGHLRLTDYGREQKPPEEPSTADEVHDALWAGVSSHRRARTALPMIFGGGGRKRRLGAPHAPCTT